MHLPGRIFRIIIVLLLIMLSGCKIVPSDDDCKEAYEKIVKEKVKSVDKEYIGEVVTVDGVKYPKQDAQKIIENFGCL